MPTDATKCAEATRTPPPFPGGWIVVELWPKDPKAWAEGGTPTIHATEELAVAHAERCFNLGLITAYRVFRLPPD